MGSAAERGGGEVGATPPAGACDYAAAADRCGAAAADVERQLGRLRGHLASLEPGGLGLTAARFEALLAGYDVYVRMLADALTDIAAALADRAVAGQAAPSSGSAVAGTASQVMAELAALRRVLEPLARRPAGAGARLGPEDEWNIAADGLFGPTGVLSVIVRASGGTGWDQSGVTGASAASGSWSGPV
ncbi:hypothetical protein [Micromonospora sp. KLBMP9576]|uniref:hypothetical protein n=1 Tax=Micromonospora sp. KLBMP9576 TaxID=3424769 RepID=UPI003D94BFE2